MEVNFAFLLLKLGVKNQASVELVVEVNKL